MLYTIIILLVVSQAVYFFISQKMLLSLKKRYKLIDARISNLNEWLHTNNKSTLQQLERSNELIYGLYAGGKLVDMNKPKAVAEKPVLPVPDRERVSHEQRVSVFFQERSRENTHYNESNYFSFLADQLQQLNNNISNLNFRQDAFSYPDSPMVNNNQPEGQLNNWQGRVNKII